MHLNERDDLLLPGERKISGTAARIASGRAYHHLTLLVDTDLEALRRSLTSPLAALISTNATRSTRAKAVGQLSQDVPDVCTDEVAQMVVPVFAAQFGETEVVQLSAEEVLAAGRMPGLDQTIDQLKSDEWVFRKTPLFTLVDGNGGSVVVEKGRVSESSVPGLEKAADFPINLEL